MLDGNPILVVTLITIALILILLVANGSLFDNIKSQFSELAKSISSIIEDLVLSRAVLLDIKNMLIEKRPLDLQILQKIMLYLADEGLIEMPVMIFEERFINDQHFIIKFKNPHLQLMIEIIAKYTECDPKADFPEIAHNRKENPEIVIRNWGEKLKEYFAKANKLLGK